MTKEKKAKRKPPEPDPDILYCPICRRQDQLRDDPDIPQMSECARCGIEFYVEEIAKEEDDPIVSEPANPVYADSVVDPVVGNMVELTGDAHV